MVLSSRMTVDWQPSSGSEGGASSSKTDGGWVVASSSKDSRSVGWG